MTRVPYGPTLPLRRLGRRGLAAAALACALGWPGCTGDGHDPLGTPEEGAEAHGGSSLPGLAVSEPAPTTAGSASLSGSTAATGVGVAWVSLAPGALPDAISVRIRNATRGDPATSPIPVRMGGFDPVAVPADPGDELELAVQRRTGELDFLFVPVPVRRPPTVVRAEPSEGRRDVALTVRPRAIFSEPLDPESVGLTSVQLLRAGAPVGGRVALVPDRPFAVEFVPEAPLAPSTAYELVLTRQLRDLDGDPPPDVVRVRFTTQSAEVGTLTVSNVTAGGAFDLDGYRVSVDGGPGRLLELNETVSLPGLPAGERTVELVDVAGNCVVSGGATRRVTVERAAAIPLTFQVDCIPPPELTSVRLVFVRGDDGSPFQELYAMNADGSDRRQLAHGPHSHFDPAVSRDGSRIAFTRLDGEVRRRPEVYVMDADGTNPVRITREPRPHHPGSYDPNWSPDGTRIVYTVDNPCCTPFAGPGGDLWVIGADGSGLTRPSTGSHVHPAWSPDGTHFAFTRGTPTAAGSSEVEFGIWTMEVDGSGGRLVRSTGPRASAPVWSPDGSRIAWLETEESGPDRFRGTVWAMDADGGSVGRLATWTERPFFHPRSLAWSSDGRWMAMEGGTPGDYGFRTDIYLVDLDDGRLVRVTAGDGRSPAFFP